jgi:hypothetical protein
MLSNADILVNGLLGIFVLSSLVSNIFWLRCVTIAGSVFALGGYILFIDNTHWYVSTIAIVIILANFYRIWRLNQNSAHLHFSENEILLHQKVFADLDQHQYMALMRIAVWRDVEAGEILIRKGDQVTCLSLIFNGMFKVDVGKNHYIEIRNGQFIGEMSYVSGNPGSGTVIAECDSLLIEWPQQALKELVSQDHVIGNCIQALFNADLMKKLGD